MKIPIYKSQITLACRDTQPGQANNIQYTNHKHFEKNLGIVICNLFVICNLGFVILNFVYAEETTNPSVLFYQGNMAYEKAKYSEAIAEYQDILAAGYESGNLYYNLANAYFKAGRLPEAVLNYKRAMRFIPHDADLKANLEYASSLVEQAVLQKQPFFVRFFTNIFKDFSPDSLTIIFTALYLAIFLLAAAVLLAENMRKALKLPLVISAAALVIIAAGLFIKINRINQPWAVVLDKEIEARYEPFDSATAYFKLYAGQDVILVKTKGEWAFIKRPDMKAGWIKAGSIEKI